VVGNVPTDGDLPVIFTYVILNNGHGSPSVVERALEGALSTLGSKAAQAATTAIGASAGAALGATIGTAAVPPIGTALGALAGWVTVNVGGILFANCDGPVATGVRIFTARQLHEKTLGGKRLIETVEHPGVDSARGCGSNSRYTTTTSISLA
jgi:hypothetical protein